jgi:hypothetical protein
MHASRLILQVHRNLVLHCCTSAAVLLHGRAARLQATPGQGDALVQLHLGTSVAVALHGCTYVYWLAFRAEPEQNSQQVLLLRPACCTSQVLLTDAPALGANRQLSAYSLTRDTCLPVALSEWTARGSGRDLMRDQRVRSANSWSALAVAAEQYSIQLAFGARKALCLSPQR